MQPQLHPDLSRALSMVRQGQNQEALAIIAQLADGGEPDSLFTLADCHWRGVLVGRDPERALHLFKRASDAGQPMAVRAYTNLLANGATCKRDWQLALRRLEAEARIDGRRAWMAKLIAAMDVDANGDPRAASRRTACLSSGRWSGFTLAHSPIRNANS